MAPRKTAVKESKRFLNYLLLGAAIIFSFAIGLSSTKSQAQDRMIEISSREIIERLARLEEGQNGINQRIDGLEKSLNQRIDDLRQLILWGFGITFAGMFTLIGFVIWDRRTALAPAVNRMDRLEAALKEYAAKSPDLAEALKKARLL